MSLYGTFRMSDLGPPEDPDEAALDAIEEDEDFCLEFLADNWADVIELITSPDHRPDLLQRHVRDLRDSLYEAEHAELARRRDPT